MEWSQPNLRYSPGTCLEGLRKLTKKKTAMIVCVLAEIQIGYPLNTSQKCYCLIQLAWCIQNGFSVASRAVTLFSQSDHSHTHTK